MSNWIDSSEQISVAVDYYDDKHREALNKYPTAGEIEALVHSGAQISIPEFLTYFLFHRARALPSLYRTYASVRAAIATAEAMLTDLVKIEEGKVFISSDAVSLPGHVTEYIGDSVALSVMNKIHGLTEADWVPIPMKPGKSGKKTLDYQGSDGTHSVQVEAKGGVVETTSVKSGSVYKHKSDIEDKKSENPAASKTDLRYGVITTMSHGPESLHAWLLDPVPDGYERSPRDLRLIARVEFLRWIVWLVSPRSHLATALATRVAELKALVDPYELSGVPLSQGDGSSFKMQSQRFVTDYAPFFASRSRVADGPAGGIVLPTRSRDALIFVGFRAELLDLAAAQPFEQIVEYSAQQASISKTVLCTVPAGEYSSFRIEPQRLPGFAQAGAYVRFELKGLLRYSQEGLVFGVLPITAGE